MNAVRFFSEKKLLRKIVAGLALTMTLGGASARAESFRATYALSLIGLSIGAADAVASLEPNAYKIDIGVRLSGLAALITQAKGAATANGAIANATVLPSAYANAMATSTETRTVRMALNAGTVRAIDISPPFLDMEERVPVTDALKAHVVDPVSALVMSVPPGQPLVGPPACARTLPVYDGLVRFNITLSFVNVRNVHTKGYAGPVTVCAARYVPLAGYKLDSKSTKYMADNRELEVWLAPVESAHVVIPYYIMVGTTAGKLTIQAVDFQVGEKSAQTTDQPQ